MPHNLANVAVSGITGYQDITVVGVASVSAAKRVGGKNRSLGFQYIKLSVSTFQLRI